jgi:ATP-dependent RNA helicase DDX27
LNIKAENMIAHKDEIYSRPKRTWFATEREKKLLAAAAKVSISEILLYFFGQDVMHLVL